MIYLFIYTAGAFFTLLLLMWLFAISGDTFDCSVAAVWVAGPILWPLTLSGMLIMFVYSLYELLNWRGV